MLQDKNADHVGQMGKGKAGQRKFMDNLAHFLKELIVEGQEAMVFSEEGGGIESILDFATALSWCATAPWATNLRLVSH